ncbi:MAG: YciC family protein, partial [Solirubrobacterales bacterium]
MNEAVTAGGKLDIGGVFSRTGDIYKQAFGTVWVVALILLVPMVILNAIADGNGWFLNLIASVYQIVATVWLAGTIVKIVEDVESDGVVDASVGELFGLVAPRLFSLFLLSLVVGILVGIGMIFFIIPGVILALMWIVSTPSMMVENKGVFESMSRSSDLTRQNRMRILGVGLLLIVAYIVIGLVVVLLAAITPILGIIGGIAIAVAAYPYLAIIVSVL